MSEVASRGAPPAPPILRQTDDIRHAVRHLRWFKSSFASQLAVRDDVAYRLDERRLADVFVDWLRRFEAQKAHVGGREREFTEFASGLMLAALIRHDPVRVSRVPPDADRSDPAYVWPEGYAYVGYCINVRAQVMRQEFNEIIRLHPDLGDPRVWESFRENVSGDEALAIAFLDHFAGAAPNWSAPSLFTARTSADVDRLAGAGAGVGGLAAARG